MRQPIFVINAGLSAVNFTSLRRQSINKPRRRFLFSEAVRSPPNIGAFAEEAVVGRHVALVALATQP